ncbi:hypothetical protein M408DRAFT_270098 [Serendipita vermifera MAFF 305830]|uniref:Uncharacterized protein n=1 Tax=Serendipita vermifera MAFF 305830 TaxID=933852 RepID=A0A0C2WXC3_SERVB|nr:hypothetical protein M408DRAFT_270098 [Serendipita vermifera MAFF 305830]
MLPQWPCIYPRDGCSSQLERFLSFPHSLIPTDIELKTLKNTKSSVSFRFCFCRWAPLSRTHSMDILRPLPVAKPRSPRSRHLFLIPQVIPLFYSRSSPHIPRSFLLFLSHITLRTSASVAK